MTRTGRMAGIRFAFSALAILMTVSLALINPVQAQNNAPAVTLIARAILPAESYADGPPCGAALAAQTKTINGVKLPLPSQPVSGFTGIIPGTYKTTWQFLSGYAFGSRAVSGDCQMRVNLLTIDWRTPGNGSGVASPGEWLILTDPKKLVSIAKPDASRTLTGSDFQFYGLARVADGSIWAGDTANGTLLHFAADGKILSKPIQLPNLPDGALLGMGLTPDGQTLVVASRAGGSVTVQLVQTSNGAPKNGPLAYPLDSPDDTVRGWTMINANQALLIEQDNGQNEQAQIKRVYLVTLGTTLTKTLLADLLNIDDPNNLGTDPVFNPTTGYGLSNPFKFPYQEIDSIYPIDDQTLLIANNNQFPTGTGRIEGKPADTEFIQIILASKLNFQPVNFQQK